MAYSNVLASVPMEAIERLRRDANAIVTPTKEVTVSHLIGYWVTLQPLGSLLGEALDGGEPLAVAYSHPLRPPVFHTPPQVKRLYDAIIAALPPDQFKDREDWYRQQIDQVLAVFALASQRGEAVLSVLCPPADYERAMTVRWPFVSAPQG